MESRIIRVVIADDSVAMRAGIRRLLEKVPYISVVGEAGDGQKAIALVEELSPDILILDIQMPIMDGITAMKMLRQKGNKISIVILTGSNDPLLFNETINYGARDFILKEEAPELLVNAVHNAV